MLSSDSSGDLGSDSSINNRHTPSAMVAGSNPSSSDKSPIGPALHNHPGLLSPPKGPSGGHQGIISGHGLVNSRHGDKVSSTKYNLPGMVMGCSRGSWAQDNRDQNRSFDDGS